MMKRLILGLLVIAAFYAAFYAAPLAATSIRTTSPGTIVFRGGALVPRYFYSREVAGPWHVTRNRLLLYGAYSPTPRTLLEIEAPFDRVKIRGLGTSRDFAAMGNTTVWAKYRFYRTVETWGDKHAAIRVGLALPTGRSQDALKPVIFPAAGPVPLPPAVGSQLQPSGGAWSPTLDLTWGQAIRRFVYHANMQQTFAVERGGMLPGHMTRGNLDLEYVLLPRHYKEPGKELFGVLEVSAVHHTAMRARGSAVAGTGGAELLLAPGLQYIATRRLLFEASYQFPVASSAKEFQLRAKSNVLLGLRWLF